MTRRRTPSPARTLAALAALLLLAALIAGVPAALYAVSGSPIPATLPSGHQVITTLTSRDDGSLFLAAIRYLTWIAWACFTVSAGLEAASRARGRPAPRLPAIAPMQGLAAALIGAAVLSAVPFPHGPRPLPQAPRPGQVTAAAPPPRPGDRLQAVAAAMTLPATPSRTPASAAANRPGPQQHYDRYTVAEGDDLWAIAGHFLGDGERWHELYQLNHGRPQPDGRTLTDPDLIIPGWILLIPEAGSHTIPVPRAPAHPAHRGSPPPAPARSPATARPAPQPRNSSRAAPHTDRGRHHAHPRQVAVQLPSGAIIGIAVAIMVAAALTLAGIQRRRRYRPRADLSSSLRPAQPPLPAVLTALRRAARPDTPVIPAVAEPAAEDTRPGTSPDPYLEVYEPSPGPEHQPPHVPAAHPAPAPGAAHNNQAPGSPPRTPAATCSPASTPGTIPLGIRDGTEVAVSIASLGGLGLTGPGAPAAARAMLAHLLAQAPPAEDTIQPWIIIPGPDAARLLPGTQAATVPGLSIPASLEAALDEIEALILTQARTTGAFGTDDPPAPRTATTAGPGPALIATCRPGAIQRLQGILDAGHPVGATAIVLGHWDGGTTCQIAADGIVTQATPPGGGLDGVRLFTLGPGEAAAIIGVLREASGNPPAATAAASPDPDDHPSWEATPPAAPAQPGSQSRYLAAPAPPATPGPAPAPAAAAAPASTPPARSTPRAPQPRPVRLALLGPLRITADGTEISGGMRKARELLAFLAVHPEGVSGEAISAALWPDASESHATAQRNLALRKARELLRTATGKTTPKWIIHASGRYRLDPSLISTDLQEFQDALEQARHATGNETRLSACRTAVALYRGELADGTGYEWAEPYAETARRRALDAWTTIAEILQPHDPDQALAALESALAHDPYNEFLYQRIMRLQAAAGRPEAVRRTLALLESRLTDLGVTPGTATRHVAASLLGTQQPGPRGQRHPSAGPQPGHRAT